MIRYKTVLLALPLAIAAFSGQAFAHAHLETASPADGSTVTQSPGEIDATFSEPLDLKFSTLTIKDATGSSIKVGAATVKDKGETLVVPLSAPLGPGQYTVEWHVLSTDGHKSKGKFSFTVGK